MQHPNLPVSRDNEVQQLNQSINTLNIKIHFQASPPCQI